MCGLKLCDSGGYRGKIESHPVRMCGLKHGREDRLSAHRDVTSCTDVWIETQLKEQKKEGRCVTSCTDVWIETAPYSFPCQGHRGSHPVRMCGLKHRKFSDLHIRIKPSHPVRMCGLKPQYESAFDVSWTVTSCTDVWIETIIFLNSSTPAISVTSCTDVWIETYLTSRILPRKRRSHPVRMCGLKLQMFSVNTIRLFVTSCTDVWIETRNRSSMSIVIRMSHPVRMCGLKQFIKVIKEIEYLVTSCTDVWIETVQWLV